MRNVTVTFAFLLLIAVPGSLAAQARHPERSDWPSARQMLDHFERVSRSESRGSLNAIATVLADPGSFGPATVDSVLDGLQEFATSSGSRQVQLAALSWLASAGRGTVHRPIAGVAGRLARVYETASSVQVRRFAVQHLGSQADHREAAQVLRAIAMQDRSRERAPNAAHDAVWGLTHLGGPGAEVLRELHSGGLVRDPRARAAVRQIAQQRGWERMPQDDGR